MAEPFVGEIRIFSFPKVPTGWLPCDGRTLTINQYQALYALLGIKYGGDGKVNFNLPDLRGRAMINNYSYSSKQPYNPTTYALGNSGGAENVTLKATQIPAHTHQMYADNINAGFNLNAAAPPEILASPILNSLNNAPVNAYIPTPVKPTVNLNQGTISTVGGNAAHENRVPFLTLNVCIATTGYFPPRN